MKNEEFKKLLKICTENVGFKFDEKNYYYQNQKVVIVINTQKSNYDDCYYVNYGFWVKDIHDNLVKPKIKDCDVVGRFINNTNRTTEFDFCLPMLVADDLKECFNYNIENTIVPVIECGINKYFELFPKAIFAAKTNLRDYLRNT